VTADPSPVDPGHRGARRLRQAWEDYCEVIRTTGDELLRQTPPDDELDAAEGLRYLSRLVRSALEQAFEVTSGEGPQVEPMYAARTSIAQRNPDQIYLRAKLDARHDYRLRGWRGSGGALSFVTRASGFGGGEEAMTGFLDGAELAVGGDGTFEVFISQEHREGNWLPVAPGSDLLMVRELFADPEEALPSTLVIERVDGKDQEGLLSIDAAVGALTQAAVMPRAILERFGDWTQRCAAEANRFWTMDELLGAGEILRVGGSPSIDYYLGYWALEPDQALLVEVPPGRAEPWSFQLLNYWQENLNLPYSSSHLNRATARAGEDGGIHLVVAPRNPGVANWIDTARHDHGVMLFRWFGPVVERPLPQAWLVGLDEVPTEPDGAERAATRRNQVAPGYLARRIG